MIIRHPLNFTQKPVSAILTQGNLHVVALCHYLRLLP